MFIIFRNNLDYTNKSIIFVKNRKLNNDQDVYEAELKFWKEIGRNSSAAMHEVNKMFIYACLEKLVKDGKLSKKTAEEYYGVCLYTYEYRLLKFN